MCVISRVVVDLPFVPLTETIGIRRSASRIHAGGTSSPSAILAFHRSNARAWPGVNRALPSGETSRSASATAASAIAWALPDRCHGHSTIQCPGSELRCTTTGPVPSAWSRLSRRVHATIPSTIRGQRSRGTAAPSRTRAWRPGLRWPYHVRRRPTATSVLTTGASR
jgi:hypothetical protein